LNVGQMIEAILSRHTQMAGLEIQFIDSNTMDGEKFLYLHTPRFIAKSPQFKNGDGQIQYPYQTDASMQFADRQWKIIAKSADSDLYPVWSSNSLQLPIAIFLLSGILAFYLRHAGLREIERNEMLAYQTALLDAIPNPIFVFNERHEFSSCNKAYEQFFIIRREDYLGRASANLDFYSEKTKQVFSAANKEMQNKDGSTHKEISISTQTGQQYDIIYWRTRFTLGDEKTAGMIGILIDITERKQAELALQQSEQRGRTGLATK